METTLSFRRVVPGHTCIFWYISTLMALTSSSWCLSPISVSCRKRQTLIVILNSRVYRLVSNEGLCWPLNHLVTGGVYNLRDSLAYSEILYNMTETCERARIRLGQKGCSKAWYKYSHFPHPVNDAHSGIRQRSDELRWGRYRGSHHGSHSWTTASSPD